MEFLVLAIQLRKQIMIQKVMKQKREITAHKHNQYIPTQEFNKLTTEHFATKLVQADLVTKTDFDIKFPSPNKIIVSNKTKHLVIENEFKKLQAFDSIYFCGKSHFEDDGTQTVFVFQSI